MANLGQWGATHQSPIIPVASAVLPTGLVMMWSASGDSIDPDFGTAPATTQVAFFDPATGSVSPVEFSGVQASMFCPGVAYLPDGRLLINGGSSSSHTTLFDPFGGPHGSWADGAPMNISRGYNGDVTLSNGNVFTIGGSWSGIVAPKDGELWSPNAGWQLTGISNDTVMGNDLVDQAQGWTEFGDNQVWLFAMPNGRVFDAGPAPQMNWFDPAAGTATPAGTRGDDQYSVNGVCVMYAPGLIFKAGGAQAYTTGSDSGVPLMDASNAAYTIDITRDYTDPTAAPVVQKLSPMNHARAYADGVVLPDGEVLILGGQSQPLSFTDNNSVMTPEIWNPATGLFTDLASMPTPRNYHSSAVLLPDGRVMVGGGGQCGDCGDGTTPDPTANHFDFDVFSPPYLFAADGSPAPRPTITGAPPSMTLGAPLTVSVSGAVTSFSLVRMSGSTHTVNNDQRRIPLSVANKSADSSTFTLVAPADPGVTVPGYYMLFALDGNNVPSVASIIQVSASGTPAPSTAPPPAQTPPPTIIYITPGAGSFSDAAGNAYTLDANGDAQENGAPIPGGSGTGKMAFASDTVYAQDSGTGDWYRWNQHTWLGPVIDGPVTGAPTPNTVVTPQTITIPPDAAQVTEDVSYATIQSSAGDHMVFINGSRNTVTLTGGNETVQAPLGQNTITTGAGDDSIEIGGSGNIVDAGGGNNVVIDDGSTNAIVLPAAGKGFVDIYGPVLTNGDALNVHDLLLDAGWKMGSPNIGDFLQVTQAGSDVTLSVTEQATGTPTAVANLHGAGPLDLQTLIPFLQT